MCARARLCIKRSMSYTIWYVLDVRATLYTTGYALCYMLSVTDHKPHNRYHLL